MDEDTNHLDGGDFDRPIYGCPHCGSGEYVSILYGMPTEELVERMAAGECDVVLGGCCIRSASRRPTTARAAGRTSASQKPARAPSRYRW